MAKVVQLIHAEISRGEGVPGDPVRVVDQYWTFLGELLWECDRFKEPDRLSHYVPADVSQVIRADAGHIPWQDIG